MKARTQEENTAKIIEIVAKMMKTSNFWGDRSECSATIDGRKLTATTKHTTAAHDLSTELQFHILVDGVVVFGEAFRHGQTPPNFKELINLVVNWQMRSIEWSQARDVDIRKWFDKTFLGEGK